MARVFDNNANNRLQVSSAPVTVPPCTMFAWVYPTGGFGGLVIGVWYEDSVNWTGIYMAGNACNTADNHAFSTPASFSPNPSLNTWNSYISVFDNSGPSHQIWLNGGSSDGAQTDTKTSFTFTPNRLMLGATGDQTPAIPFDGRVAWPCIWNIALTASDRAKLDAGAHPLVVQPANIVSFWGPLNGTGGITDLVGSFDLTEAGTVALADGPPLPPPLRYGLFRKGT